jgi:hypothetical protein
VLEPPIKFPRNEIRQHGHQRDHHDAANKCLRELVAQLLKD